MSSPRRQIAEADRLATLRRYDILDSPPDGAFDRIARLAANVCGTPIAVVSLVDENRVWFKARYGLRQQGILDDLEAAHERLAKFATICSWTRKILHQGEWLTVEQFLRRRFGLVVTHGISEEARKQIEMELEINGMRDV